MSLVFPQYKTDLFEYIVDHKEVETLQRIEWLLQITDGLEWLHKNGVIHRDLTLRNIMYSNPVVIADLESRHTSKFCNPPEGGEFGPEGDVYALGFCIWQLENRNYPRPFTKLKISGALEPLFRRCRTFYPNGRPTVAQIRGILGDVKAEIL